jgi:hypothetical protein
MVSEIDYGWRLCPGSLRLVKWFLVVEMVYGYEVVYGWMVLFLLRWFMSGIAVSYS